MFIRSPDGSAFLIAAVSIKMTPDEKYRVAKS